MIWSEISFWNFWASTPSHTADWSNFPSHPRRNSDVCWHWPWALHPGARKIAGQQRQRQRTLHGDCIDLSFNLSFNLSNPFHFFRIRKSRTCCPFQAFHHRVLFQALLDQVGGQGDGERQVIGRNVDGFLQVLQLLIFRLSTAKWGPPNGPKDDWGDPITRKSWISYLISYLTYLMISEKKLKKSRFRHVFVVSSMIFPGAALRPLRCSSATPRDHPSSSGSWETDGHSIWDNDG